MALSRAEGVGHITEQQLRAPCLLVPGLPILIPLGNRVGREDEVATRTDGSHR